MCTLYVTGKNSSTMVVPTSISYTLDVRLRDFWIIVYLLFCLRIIKLICMWYNFRTDFYELKTFSVQTNSNKFNIWIQTSIEKSLKSDCHFTRSNLTAHPACFDKFKMFCSFDMFLKNKFIQEFLWNSQSHEILHALQEDSEPLISHRI